MTDTKEDDQTTGETTEMVELEELVRAHEDSKKRTSKEGAATPDR